jgi:DNA adenine methylase
MIAASSATIVNVASVPQRSPFRYPGGKTWLVPHIRMWLKSLEPRPKELIEPFAGGAIVGLTAAFEHLVQHVTLVELDDDVAAVWHTVLGDHAARLVDRVASFTCSPEGVHDVLTGSLVTEEQRAFATLLRNRVQYGGIIAPGASLVRRGENGRGVSSRWYPTTLRKRILAIIDIRDMISFIHGDGLEILEASTSKTDAVFFIDPPYTVAGRRLYAHSQIDHKLLFEVVSRLAGDFLMTYDAADEIRRLAYRYGFDVVEVPMKTTKHVKTMELLIGRCLDWARRPLDTQLGPNPLFETLQTDGNAGSEALNGSLQSSQVHVPRN